MLELHKLCWCFSDLFLCCLSKINLFCILIFFSNLPYWSCVNILQFWFSDITTFLFIISVWAFAQFHPKTSSFLYCSSFVLPLATLLTIFGFVWRVLNLLWFFSIQLTPLAKQFKFISALQLFIYRNLIDSFLLPVQCKTVK